MQNQTEFENYLKGHRWEKANEWLEVALRFMRTKLAFQRIINHTFGVLMSVVLAFFTWVILYPSADKKELAAFPLATLSNDLFVKLCEIVPGGKAVVISGLLLAPFLVSAVLAILFCCINPKKGKKTTAKSAKEVENRLNELGKVQNKYSEPYALVLYFLFAGLLSGGVMVFSAVPAGLNPFEYIFVGLICDVAYFLIFMGSYLLFGGIRERFGVPTYTTYAWREIVSDFITEKTAKAEDTTYIPQPNTNNAYYQEKFNEYYARYMGQDYETEEERAKRIALEIEGELTGKGYGDY